MGKKYKKNALIKELAVVGHMSQRRTEQLLEALTQIAYREAHTGFVVPGICRLDVVHRRARQVRNPQTSQILQIAEHDALRVRPLKRARKAIAPTPKSLIQIVSHPGMNPGASPDAEIPIVTVSIASLPQEIPVAKPAPPPALKPLSAAEPDDEGQFISFRCKNCNQEIEAPLEMVGAPNECPTCGENLMVPYLSEEGTVWFQTRAAIPETLPSSSNSIAAMKSRTIRIELPDDF